MTGWLLAGIALAAVIGWLLGRMRPAPAGMPPQRLSVDLQADAANTAATLAAHLNAPRLRRNRIELLVNGDRIFPPMLEAIGNARESINLLTYIYWTGDIATQFADALATAARRGVQVRVLLDGFGAKRITQQCLDTMRDAGCEVAWYHPLRWGSLRRFNRRTHRKILVVDGQVGFTGGVGIAAEWTGDAQGPDHWRDNHFRLHGPVVAYLQGSFAENWLEATREVLGGEALFAEPEAESDDEAEVVAINADASKRYTDIALVYWVLFHAAHRRVSIATPYFAPDPDLELGLAEAARRGVEVTLLVPGPHNDSRLIRHASRTYYRRLLEAGVRVHEYQPTLLHTKTVLVDGRWALIGSSNFDSRSLRHNAETVLAVFDADLVQALSAAYDQDLARSEPVTLAEVRSWPWHIRSLAWAARMLRWQL